MFKEPMSVVAQFYDGFNSETGHEYLLPTRVADRFIRFWNRPSIRETTEVVWIRRDW